MPAKYPIDRVLASANKILNTWSNHPEFMLGDITQESFLQTRTKLEELTASVDSVRTELTGLLNERDDQVLALQELITRARSGFRAIFGPDSKQYEQVGGTRSSERKRPRLTVKPSVAAK